MHVTSNNCGCLWISLDILTGLARLSSPLSHHTSPHHASLHCSTKTKKSRCHHDWCPTLSSVVSSNPCGFPAGTSARNSWRARACALTPLGRRGGREKSTTPLAQQQRCQANSVAMRSRLSWSRSFGALECMGTYIRYTLTPARCSQVRLMTMWHLPGANQKLMEAPKTPSVILLPPSEYPRLGI